MNVLLTGSSGFIGSSLAKAITAQNHFNLAVALRGSIANSPYTAFSIDGLTKDTNWSTALVEQQVVIHAAARAHIMKDEVTDPLAEYRRINVEGTLNLARQAAAAGVKRFIFISSIGVNGNINTKPFTADNKLNPADLYAQSKWEAEQGLWQIATETDLELVIIRPPLVYGANAPGNFGSLVRWVNKGIPLPLGAVHNQRSLVAIDNLVDLIITCVDHPAATNQVFLAADGEDVSTSELLRGVSKAMGKPARLLPVPVWMLQLGAILLGKKAVAQRLLGSLQVDITKTCNVLGWKPPLTLEQGLARCFESESN